MAENTGAQTMAPETPSPAPAAPEAPKSWTDGLDETFKGLVETRGWDGPEAAIKAYADLEKLSGLDKDKLLTKPAGDDDKEALEAIYKTLGRPDDAAGYDLGKALDGETVDPNFMATMAAVMHEAGLSKTQATQMATAYQTQYRQAMEQFQLRSEAEALEFKTECGAEYPKQLECGRRGAKFLDLSKEHISAMEQAIGTKAVMRALAKVGAALAEDAPVSGAESAGTFSVAGAKARLDQLMSDKQFSARYLAGDKSAIDQFTKLAMLACQE